MNFKTYLKANARKLDLRLYECLFEKADAQPLLNELSKYQNNDGGFGNGLEPDIRLPGSSPLATTIALQYLAKVVFCGVISQNPATKAIAAGVAGYGLNPIQWYFISSDQKDSR